MHAAPTELQTDKGTTVTNYLSGHSAEIDAAEYLRRAGFEIIELNWKTPNCEIDIVARKGKSVYFVEVKSRKNDLQGSGLDYITSKKLKQMKFAAEKWTALNRWNGAYQLAAIGITNGSIIFIDEIWV